MSEYISKPHLIEGFKYDLRLYVLVTSFDPLWIYLYEEGLVRFATEEYSDSRESLNELYVHLTNYAVNKTSENFVANEKGNNDAIGSKWSLWALRRKFKQMKLNYDEVYDKIQKLIVKTLFVF